MSVDMTIVRMAKKFISNPLGALKNRRIKYFRAIGHKRYKRFIVLTHARTGSNMLISMLNSHPKIFAAGEIFMKLDGKTPEQILDSTFTGMPYFISAVGFKIFSQHPLDSEDSRVWEVLKNMNDLFVIRLTRRNILRSIVSRKISFRTKKWVQYKKTEQDDKIALAEKRVEFTFEELEKEFEQILVWEKLRTGVFEGRPVLDITYEDFVHDTSFEFRRITDFLGIPYARPKTIYEKQNPEPLGQLVINYEELKARFSGTKWERYFE